MLLMLLVSRLINLHSCSCTTAGCQYAVRARLGTDSRMSKSNTIAWEASVED